MPPTRIETLLKHIYYDPSHIAGFGTAQQLFKAVKAKRKNVKLKHVNEFLEKQDAYTLHKRIVRKFPRRKFISKGLHEIWQADLVDMQKIQKENRGFRYLLTSIDIFSRQAFAIPIKSKKPDDIIKAFTKILKQAGTRPHFLNTDRGGEFLNRKFQAWLTAKSINHYHTFNQEIKASLIERFNRTLRSRMFKYFRGKNTLHYLKALPDLVASYNNRKHRTIGIAPNKVNRKNEKEIWDKQYKDYLEQRKKRFRYKINDTVRITSYKKTFQKGYERGWTEEKFKIVDRLDTLPPTYKLSDLKNEVLEGTFYEQELGKAA